VLGCFLIVGAFGCQGFVRACGCKDLSVRQTHIILLLEGVQMNVRAIPRDFPRYELRGQLINHRGLLAPSNGIGWLGRAPMVAPETCADHLAKKAGDVALGLDGACGCADVSHVLKNLLQHRVRHCGRFLMLQNQGCARGE